MGFGRARKRADMNKLNKAVRDWIKNDATAADIDQVKREALLTPRQREVLDHVVVDDSQVKTAMDMCIDVSTVKKLVKQVYKKISNVLSKRLVI